MRSVSVITLMYQFSPGFSVPVPPADPPALLLSDPPPGLVPSPSPDLLPPPFPLLPPSFPLLPSLPPPELSLFPLFSPPLPEPGPEPPVLPPPLPGLPLLPFPFPGPPLFPSSPLSLPSSPLSLPLSPLSPSSGSPPGDGPPTVFPGDAGELSRPDMLLVLGSPSLNVYTFPESQIQAYLPPPLTGLPLASRNIAFSYTALDPVI